MLKPFPVNLFLKLYFCHAQRYIGAKILFPLSNLYVHIEKLTLSCFKNHNDVSFEFSSGVNCIHGSNGAGKTNVLDAIYFLGNGRSYFSRIDQQSIPFDLEFARFQGTFEHNDVKAEHLIVLQNSGKKSIERNGSVVRKLSDIVGRIPIVIITPGDIQLIIGASEERRRFIDRAIAMMNPAYVSHLQRYNKLLLMRNELLKKFAMDRHVDELALESIDVQLIPEGDAIYALRSPFVEKLSTQVFEIYEWLSNSKEEASVAYSSGLYQTNMTDLLEQQKRTDLASQRTSLGVHRDDLELSLDDIDIRKYGSQGQIKTFTISLHLAIFRILSKELDIMPILLLDDIYEKIDDERAAKLMNLISGNGYGQIFITDTSLDRMVDQLINIDAEKKFFNIERAKGTIDS